MTFAFGHLEIDPVTYAIAGSAVLGIRDSGKTYTATEFFRMMTPTRYDREIADLERKLRALKVLQRRERKAAEPPKPRKAVRKPKRPREIQEYWDLLRSLGCVVSGLTNGVTIHHCHGGSMIERGVVRKAGRKTSDWLVIPLHETYHSWGRDAIDGAVNGGVKSWELRHGRQVDFIDALVTRTGIDVWKLSGVTA